MEEKKVNKKDKIVYKNLEFKREIIKDDPFNLEQKVFIHGKEFKIEISFNEDRSKFQCWVTHEGIRKSLSFFQKKDQAVENSMNKIILMIGEVTNKNIYSGVGD